MQKLKTDFVQCEVVPLELDNGSKLLLKTTETTESICNFILELELKPNSSLS